MKNIFYTILILVLSSQVFAKSNKAKDKGISCSGEGYSFLVIEDRGQIKTPRSTFDMDVRKTGSNYSGLLGEDGFFAYRFSLTGNKGELKLIGRKSVTKKMNCLILK